MRFLVLLAAAATLGAQDLPDISYDLKQPLAFEQKLVKDLGGVSLFDVSFDSPRGGRVTAYAVVPSGPAHAAGIVWQHWGQGDRSSFVPEAIAMARRGAASILVDWPNRRPQPPNPKTAEESLRVWLQGAIDLRRAADVLVAQYGVDERRLGYVGHSTGATLGGLIAVGERRFRALVLMGGFAAISETIEDKEGAAVFAPIDAEKYLGRATPAALLLQFARYDRFITEEQAWRYIDAASSPKVVRWYECGHEFNDRESAMEREDWLAQRLGLRKRQR